MRFDYSDGDPDQEDDFAILRGTACASCLTESGFMDCKDSLARSGHLRGYTKPMGVATYKTLGDMPEAFREALPDEDDLKKLL